MGTMTSTPSPGRTLHVLIVDDDTLAASSLERAVRLAGHEVTVERNGEAALERLKERKIDLVLCDLGLQGEMDGLELIRAIAGPQSPPIVVVTGRSSRAYAAETMRAGAEEFLEKPLSLEIVRRTLDRVVAEHAPRSAPTRSWDVDVMLATARSPAMKQLLEQVRRCAATSARAVIVGEAGTGKGVVARYLHGASARGEGPFVRMNMAALGDSPDEVLLGRSAKRSTPARSGLVADANRGTLLLDAMEEIPLEAQAMLLRVLETSRVHPLGAMEPKPVDVRFMATTALGSKEALRAEGLRSDLYYRISEVVIHVPPLRERREDIVPLALAFLDQACDANGKPRLTLRDSAIEPLEAYEWPGNVRELRHAAERAAGLASGESIGRGELVRAGLPMQRLSGARPSSMPPLRRAALR